MLRLLPEDQKWSVLQQHLEDRYVSKEFEEVRHEYQIVERLKAFPDKDSLNDVAILLRSRPIRWISNFIEYGGLGVLVENLKLLETENRFSRICPEYTEY